MLYSNFRSILMIYCRGWIWIEIMGLLVGRNLRMLWCIWMNRWINIRPAKWLKKSWMERRLLQWRNWWRCLTLWRKVIRFMMLRGWRTYCINWGNIYWTLVQWVNWGHNLNISMNIRRVIWILQISRLFWWRVQWAWMCKTLIVWCDICLRIGKVW